MPKRFVKMGDGTIAEIIGLRIAPNASRGEGAVTYVTIVSFGGNVETILLDGKQIVSAEELKPK